jgi:hypothetical protein
MPEPRDQSLNDALYYAGGLLWEWGVLEAGLNAAIAHLRRGNPEALARPPTDFDKRFGKRIKEWRSLQVAAHGAGSDQVKFVDELIASINEGIEHRHNIAHGILGALEKPDRPTAIVCTVDHYRKTLGGFAPVYEDYDADRLVSECERARNLANLLKLATYGKVTRKSRKKRGQVSCVGDPVKLRLA